ncbi:Zn-finger domain of CDGSH type-containing protein [Candidatus Kryptonium thompsonii]|uniref:Zn-finger domain of CDGSH type-containing protein n=1 Tax=Candidatus Kryptonium thompsonii TaxID=1633631 RepID=A0A0N7MUV5_9BACT|nr:CDGSH iron-sulfur domain-containing protein [Candidatus Kryptonium thompsoni]CUS80210.1 Zn-finger domain of CDGSH type-containing protein [Candidatus Kryptonium thompsoni]CUS82331.1 Zn-finger domain of CDGSH type-containing protein [Candidatus Kryptonium thompsoni]CUS83013.1 Zn-finger domain of CDGSH type-containing protein [Candidatus Kryptonium thompsoni]CUS84771.1 Zn-finger domain of CDGSH type-containing protein [Candidatus Kryptonium thompsoni]CUS86726.1 Zn-finger domain of CDGSH type-
MAKIKASENGPYLIEIESGSFEVERDTGKELIEKKTIALCRCGGSENKPFCDGTHRKIGFSAKGANIKIVEASKKI